MTRNRSLSIVTAVTKDIKESKKLTTAKVVLISDFIQNQVESDPQNSTLADKESFTEFIGMCDVVIGT